MAQGIRQGTFFLSPKMKGKDEENEGADCVAGKLIFPMQLLENNNKISHTHHVLHNVCKMH